MGGAHNLEVEFCSNLNHQIPLPKTRAKPISLLYVPVLMYKKVSKPISCSMYRYRYMRAYVGGALSQSSEMGLDTCPTDIISTHIHRAAKWVLDTFLGGRRT